MANITPTSALRPGEYIRGKAEDFLQEETSGVKAMIRGTAEMDRSGQSTIASQLRGDTVSISEEAQKLSDEATQEAEDQKSGLTASGMRPVQEDEDTNSADQIKTIRKQIEEVKKQLEDAKARLAMAQGGPSADSASNEGKDPSQAATDKAMAALGNSVEAEGIQAEIEMLNQQLMMLNQQLVEAMGGGGSPEGATGTAGLGGEATGPSGQGERIEVSA